MKTEVKTSIDGLEIGMFVSRLDRPWIKTPFPIEGFKLSCKDDIEHIRKFCNYVYVNVVQGVAPDPRYWILTNEPKMQVFGNAALRRDATGKSLDSGRNEYTALRKTTYAQTEKFSVEVTKAKQISDEISANYKEMLADLEQGRDLDMEVVRNGVSDMVDSVVRNPDAMMWIMQLKKMDEYTYSRALGTSVWCATFGRHLGLEKKTINRLALGGLLLDVGKSRLPIDLLKKKGALTGNELGKMHEHVDLSIKILATSLNKSARDKLDIDVLQMVATHHERFDGSGYPQGLVNQDVPIFGRIAGIVDSYDAMTSERPYRDKGPLTPHDAIADLYQLRDTKFQAELVEQFIQTVGLYPTGSLVELSTGQVGAVVEINGLRRLQPTVMLILDENKEPYAEFNYLNLSTTEDAVTMKRALPHGAYGIDMHEIFL